MTETHDQDDDHGLGLYDFLELYGIALARGGIRAGAAAVLIWIARTSKGLTGREATIDASRLAAELGLSERQIWRHVRTLTDAGWIERTTSATRGDKGKRGRRARYRLTRPLMFRSDETPLFPLTQIRKGMADVIAEEASGKRQTIPAGNAESPDVSVGNHLTFPNTSSDKNGQPAGTLLDTDGSDTDGFKRVVTSPTQVQTARTDDNPSTGEIARKGAAAARAALASSGVEL